MSEHNDMPALPEPALKGDEGACCGNYVTGAEYMGQRETLCCGNPDGAYPDSFTADQMHAYAKQYAEQRVREEREAIITELGGLSISNAALAIARAAISRRGQQ